MDQETLIKDLRRLRLRLAPILSDRYKKVLIEAEKQLSGGTYTPPAKPINPLKKKNPTKKELREYFNS